MSRRRKKNTLLPKMMLLAVLVNAILLPILAQLGVFKAGKARTNILVTLIKLPPPEPKPKLMAKKAQPKHQTAHKAAAKPAPSPRSLRPDLPHPNLVAAKPGPGSSDGTSAASVNPTGSLKAGTVPIAPQTPATSPPAANTVPQTPPPPVVQPKPTVPVAPLAPIVKPAPHIPLVVAAKVISEIKPTVPEDLEIDQTPQPFHAAFHIFANGKVDVTQTASTGNNILDDLALNAAKQWKFNPATRDGSPIDSFLRLTVDFDERS